MELVKLLGLYLFAGIIVWVAILLSLAIRMTIAEEKDKDVVKNIETDLEPLISRGQEILADRSERIRTICKALFLWPQVTVQVYSTLNEVVQTNIDRANQRYEMMKKVKGDE